MKAKQKRLVLGLDVGANSIGWALVDIDNETIDASGVRIFPEGVDRDQQGGEQSKSQVRRESRGLRRQICRRSRRKRSVRQALQRIGLLPTDQTALNECMEGESPYLLRKEALERKLTPHELGRVFYQLATRRGFLSNRKVKSSEDQGILKAIGELQELLDEKSETLGQFLYRQDQQFSHQNSEQRPIRRRYTRRSMYEAEFEAIWSAQLPHHPALLTEVKKYGRLGKAEFPADPQARQWNLDPVDQYGLYGLLFFQRRMYWPRSIVGQCELTDEFDPNKRCRKKRCSKADRSAQEFRILHEVNNLRVLEDGQDRRLTTKEQEIVVESLLTTKQQLFSAIRKKLGFHESMTFNIERGGRDKLKGHETDAAMASNKGVGKRWRSLPDAAKDLIVEVCTGEPQEEVAIRRLVGECDLTPEEAVRAVNVNLPDGYMHFCRSAIERLIPHLRQGKLLMGEDASNSAVHAAGYLRPDERVVNVQTTLPAPPDLPNPLVRQALYEVRKTVNAIIGQHGKPYRIHIELARDAKKSFEERQEIRFENSKRERRREQISQLLIDEYDIKPTRNNVTRYLLWDEQGGDCLYCGNKVSPTHLFTGDADIDHILPRWRSLDDSMTNKVVCHRRCNDEKRDRTAREWLESIDQPRYEKMLQLARRLDYRKRQKLQQLDIDLSDFVERQLRDTSYISRCVKQYLECLGAPVVCPRGEMTKDLRHWWGLNNLLDPDKKGRKNRRDHRHHAVDAIAIALTDQSRLNTLANAKGENMPLPWKNFLLDARNSIQSINVSHRSQRRISGALHEATIYGPTQKQQTGLGADTRPWAKDRVEDANIFVRRKDITSIKNGKHLEKIRDQAIRETLAQHLKDMGVDPYGRKAYPNEAFKGENLPRMKNKKHPDQPGVPIKRVRMLEESQTFRQVSNRRSMQYAKPGNNHHIVYWSEGEGENEKWSADVTTMWDAAQRARSGLQPVNRIHPQGKRFVMSLSGGEMFEMADKDGEIILCVVRKLDQRSKRVYYKRHIDAREADEVNKDNLYLTPGKMRDCGARKVTVDPLGRVRWAND